MFKNVVFVGGVHGVGKTTICQKIAIDLGLEYLSASEVLKWVEINSDKLNKKVEDIPFTQDRLIRGLKEIVVPKKRYLLDGHYCLFNGIGESTRIPLSTFQEINPFLLLLVTGNVDAIVSNLIGRDNKSYSHETMSNMQRLEQDYAVELANSLNVDLVIEDKNNYDIFLNAITSKI